MKQLATLLLTLFLALQAKAQFSDAPITVTDCPVGIRIVKTDGSSTPIEPIRYYKVKAGSGIFLSGLTYGIAKVKNKNYYKGRTSPNVIKTGEKFRFSFGEIPEGAEGTLHMFASNYTIRNFSLIKFDQKKDHRELTTGEGSMWSGYDGGAKEESDAIKFTVKVVEPNVYEATIESAQPGEYGFIFTDKGDGAYESIFDFSIPQVKKIVKKDPYDDIY